MSQEPGAAAGGSGWSSPMGIGDVLSNAFAVYGKHWQRLLSIAAILIVPVTLVVYLVFYLALVNSLSIAAIAFGATLGGLLQWILFALVQAAVTRGAAAAILEDPAADQAYSYGLKRLGSFLWIGLLVGLIIASPFILVVLLFLVSPGLGFGLGIIAIIAAIFLGTMLAIAVPALVVENRRGTDALARSWELVKGHFWHVFGAMFVAGLITGVVAYVIDAIFTQTFNWVMWAIGDIITFVVTLPFMALVSITLYVDLRSRVESVSRDQLRRQLEASG